MHSKADPDRTHRLIRNAGSSMAAALVGVRVADLTGAVTLTTHGGAGVLVAFIASALIAAWGGYRIKARNLEQRAQSAEWEAARLRRDELLDDDADRELWDSIPAHPIDDDTCAFGLNVIAINQYSRYPEAG